MKTSDSLLEKLGAGRFREVEDACVDLFRDGRLRDPRARARAAILSAQARILGRLDARGAMSALLAALSDPGWSSLTASDLARANVIATIAVTAPARDLTVPYGLARALSAAGAGLARAMDPDLRALAAVAMLGGGADRPDPERVARFGDEVAADLDAASAPVTRCLAIEARAARGGPRSKRLLSRGIGLAGRIGFDAAEARMLLASAETTDDAGRRERALESAKAALRRGGIAAGWLWARAGS